MVIAANGLSCIIYEDLITLGARGTLHCGFGRQLAL